RLTVRGKGRDVNGMLFDGSADPRVAASLLGLVERGRVLRGTDGEIVGVPTSAFQALRGAEDADLQPSPVSRDPHTPSMAFGKRLLLKLLRRVPEGISPEVELGRFLTEHTSFVHVAPLAGHLEYRPDKGPAVSLAVLQAWVANEGDAWAYTLDEIDRSF